MVGNRKHLPVVLFTLTAFAGCGLEGRDDIGMTMGASVEGTHTIQEITASRCEQGVIIEALSQHPIDPKAFKGLRKQLVALLEVLNTREVTESAYLQKLLDKLEIEASYEIEAQVVNLIDDLANLLGWLEVLARVEFGTEVGNATLGSESDDDTDFMDFLDWLLGMGSGGSGVSRMTRIGNAAAERQCGCDKNGDGFIGDGWLRDKNHNGKCDGNEDCDGDGKPGYCADCGWKSYAFGANTEMEQLLVDVGATEFTNFLADASFLTGTVIHNIQTQMASCPAH